jgi:hypothetical protein
VIRKPASWQASVLVAPTLRLLRCLRFSELVTGMHFHGPVANGRANGQMFHGDADGGARTLGLPGNRQHNVGAV